MNIAKQWERMIMSPWAKTFMWGMILLMAGLMLYYDGINAMDAIERQAAAQCKCSVNLTQTLVNMSWG